MPKQTQKPAAAAATLGAETNLMAILSIIFAFVFFPLGLVFGIIALNEIKKNPSQQGRGFAIAGIIISCIPLAIIVLFILFFVLIIGAAAAL